MYRHPIPSIRWLIEGETAWRPATDVYEIDEGIVVIVEIAGLSEGDFVVELNGRTLVVSGERRDPVEKLAYQQMEIHYGRFRTEVNLPFALDSDGQAAVYEDGFLRISLRKAQSRRVPVKTEEPES